MSTPLALAAVLCALLAPGVPAAAQVESHVLADHMPIVLLPPHVTALPPANCQQLAVPPEQDSRKPPIRPDTGAAGKGDPDAVALADMLEKPRKVIELALAGDYKAADEKGQELLLLPRETCADYTWDYLANAVAWACVQLGKLPEAANAHRLAALRINDPAVRQYHQFAASVLALEPPRPAAGADDAPPALTLADLRKPDVYRNELKKKLADPAKLFDRALQQAAKADSADRRLSALRGAYDNLRVVCAAAADAGRPMLTQFRAAADGLVVVHGAVALKNARDQQATVARLESVPLKPSQYDAWNDQVFKLWRCVREVKRLCRVHEYLRRLQLAESADAKALFDDAHKLLFSPNNSALAYQLLGTRSAGTLDYRRCAPYSDDIYKYDK